MKRVLATILAVLYLGTSSGATVHFHYCMGELIKWGLNSDNSKVCSNCGMQKKKAANCCKEESQHVKIEKAQSRTDSPVQLKLVPQLISAELFMYPLFAKNSAAAQASQLIHAPPVYSGIPPIILFCTYRI